MAELPAGALEHLLKGVFSSSLDGKKATLLAEYKPGMLRFRS
jgi:hypothetical protein